MANILIGCECSGALRLRFRIAGHNAVSCDFKEAEDGSPYHIREDVIAALTTPLYGAKWDLFICHPDCTALTVAGNHVYAAGKPKHHKRLAAIEWTGQLWLLAKKHAHRVAFENPQGVLSTQSVMGKATQYVHPYEFGDDASKKTGWWLHNLPPLKPTKRKDGRWVTAFVKGRVSSVERWANQTDSGQNRLGPSPTRATDRARTYPGMAKAVTEQWGELL